MPQELVSIITPMYNAEKFVTQTIESVIAQTYPYWEMIIVNDGSKDNCAKIVEQYAQQDSRIQLIAQPNAGSASARNNALDKAKGKYICFIDSDDIVYPQFLEKQLDFMIKKNALLVTASYNRINEDGEKILKPFIVPNKMSYKDILITNPISCLTTIYNAEKLGKFYFRPELKSLRDDYAMWLEVLKKVDYCYGNKDVLASYRVFSSSTTGKKIKVIKPQFLIYYRVEKLGLIKSCFYTLTWAINGFLKYKK